MISSLKNDITAARKSFWIWFERKFFRFLIFDDY